MKKCAHLSCSVCPQSYGHENETNSSSFVFCADDSKNSYNLGKVFKCIRKVLFSCFSNCYGLLGSELPLAKCQPLKIRDLGIFC